MLPGPRLPAFFVQRTKYGTRASGCKTPPLINLAVLQENLQSV